jgi:hypothetical protein
MAFKTIVGDYEKASGNTIDYTLMPFAPHRQKIISALTSGVVPDLFPNNPVEILALLCLGQRAGQCQRCRRNAEIAVHRNGIAHRLLLQQRREAA